MVVVKKKKKTRIQNIIRNIKRNLFTKSDLFRKTLEGEKNESCGVVDDD